ncbi:MAG: glycosyltransferase family 4 protein [Planctomycetota bacterium]
MSAKPHLLFVCPVFLFPPASGGRIRTSQILRGMKGGAFEITLCSPAPKDAEQRHRAELAQVCDRFVGWPEPRRGRLFKIARLRHLLSPLPIPAETDRTRAGSRVVARELAARPDVVVFDFLHSVVVAPKRVDIPAVMFTHNVEAEIFRRHRDVASNPVARWVWQDQLAKMARLEREALARFDTVVAVSERDAGYFRERCGIEDVAVIPTGVDLDYFAYQPPGDADKVIFTGSMDWMANIDAMEYLLAEIWPEVVARRPTARMVVIGRSPPAHLVRQGGRAGWELTGFVDDVRDAMAGASAYVIPLRVGGGTRIKAYEAMAHGCPIVSTSVGVEGLPLEPDRHYLLADDAGAFASAIVRLLEDRELRARLSRAARAHVEAHFSCERVAAAFEKICRATSRCTVA